MKPDADGMLPEELAVAIITSKELVAAARAYKAEYIRTHSEERSFVEFASLNAAAERLMKAARALP